MDMAQRESSALQGHAEDTGIKSHDLMDPSFEWTGAGWLPAWIDHREKRLSFANWRHPCRSVAALVASLTKPKGPFSPVLSFD
jgi:hypothetical protein